MTTVRSRIATLVLIAGATCSFASIAMAQDAKPDAKPADKAPDAAKPARVTDEAGKKLHAAMLEALKNYKSLSFKVAAKLEGMVVPGGAGTSYEADITLGEKVTGGPFPRQFVVTGELPNRSGKNIKTTAAYSGKKVIELVEATKLARVAEVKAKGMPPMVDAFMVLPSEAFGELPVPPSPDLVYRSGGEATAGTVKCDVLIIDFPIPSDDGEDGMPADKKADKPETKWVSWRYLIAREDSLPRQLEYPVDPEKPEAKFVIKLNDLKLNPAVTSASFEPAIPEGYKTEELKAPTNERPPLTYDVGSMAGEWALKDADGKEYKLSDFKGKLVLIDFWATWCGPCKMAMPGIQKLHEEFKDKGVVVIGISAWERGGDPIAYMKKNNFSYLGLVNGDEVTKNYGISAIPQIYLIGRDGKVLFQNTGYDKAAEETIKETILKEIAAAPTAPEKK